VTLLDDVEASLARAAEPAIWRFPEEGRELPLSEIVAASRGYAAAFAKLGIRRQDRVGLVLENGSDYPAIILGLWRQGAIPVPLRPQVGRNSDGGAFLSRIHRACELSLLVSGDEGDAPVLTRSDDERAPTSALPCLSISRSELRALASGPSTTGNAPLAGSDIALIQYSSGSTAEPKGIIVTHDMVSRQVRSIHSEYRLACGGDPLTATGSWLPFHHDMGMFIGILQPLSIGCHNLLSSPRYYMYRPQRWFGLQAQHRVDWNFTTNLAMANSFASLERLEAGSIDLSRFHLYLAAEKVAPVVLRRCCQVLARFGMPPENVKIGYGMAENALGAASTKVGTARTISVVLDGEDRLRLARSEDPHPIEVVSVGEPHVGTQVAIVDEAGAPLPDLWLGEITVTGPCVTPGYYRDPESTRRTIKGGTLYTRDIGFQYEGELFFFARKDDVVVIGGRNISPDDIESCAEEQGGVAPGSAVLIDVPSPATGKTELVLLVEPSRELTDEEAVERRRTLQGVIYEERGVLVNRVVFAAHRALEKTSSGKKRRRIIRERFLNASLPLR
jgi:acyl-CoA synthetase (AMP-forming)/AMP-acid ligase II